MKRLIIYTVFLLSIAICYGQSSTQQPSKFDKNKLEYGGNLGLSFGKYNGSNSTSIIIAPQVGYKFDPRFSAGTGVNYSYYSWDDTKRNYFGFNVYGRVRPFNPLVLQIQPEIYRMWGSIYGESISELVPVLLIGGGVSIPIGSRSSMIMMLHYDVIQKYYTPYGNRIFYSVGYSF